MALANGSLAYCEFPADRADEADIRGFFYTKESAMICLIRSICGECPFE
jgi:hypothetical protein